jgi:hypothetical protein
MRYTENVALAVLEGDIESFQQHEWQLPCYSAIDRNANSDRCFWRWLMR